MFYLADGKWKENYFKLEEINLNNIKNQFDVIRQSLKELKSNIRINKNQLVDNEKEKEAEIGQNTPITYDNQIMVTSIVKNDENYKIKENDNNNLDDLNKRFDNKIAEPPYIKSIMKLKNKLNFEKNLFEQEQNIFSINIKNRLNNISIELDEIVDFEENLEKSLKIEKQKDALLKSNIYDKDQLESSILIDQIIEKDKEKSDNSNVNVSLESSINYFDELESRIISDQIIDQIKEKDALLESNIYDIDEMESSIIIDPITEKSYNSNVKIESSLIIDQLIEEDKDKSVDSDVNFLIESNIYESGRTVATKTGNVEEAGLTRAVNDETEEVVYETGKEDEEGLIEEVTETVVDKSDGLESSIKKKKKIGEDKEKSDNLNLNVQLESSFNYFDEFESRIIIDQIIDQIIEEDKEKLGDSVDIDSIESRIDESYEVKSSIIIDQITEKDTEKSDNSNVNVSLESSINDFDELESKILTNKIIEGDKDKSGDSVVNVPIESNIDDLNEIEFSLIIDQLIESSNNDFDEIESKILTDKIIEEDKDKSVDSDVNFLIESNIYESGRTVATKTGNVEEAGLTRAVNDETEEVVYETGKEDEEGLIEEVTETVVDKSDGLESSIKKKKKIGEDKEKSDNLNLNVQLESSFNYFDEFESRIIIDQIIDQIIEEDKEKLGDSVDIDSIESRIDESYEVKSSIIIDQITEKDTEKSDNSNVNVSLESSINDFDELESKILTNKIIEGDKDKSGDSVVNVPIESNIDDLNEIEFSLIIDQLIESSNNDFDEIESKILTDKIIEEDKDKSVDSDVNFLIESNIYESGRTVATKTGNVEEAGLTRAVNDETEEVVYETGKEDEEGLIEEVTETVVDKSDGLESSIKKKKKIGEDKEKSDNLNLNVQLESSFNYFDEFESRIIIDQIIDQIIEEDKEKLGDSVDIDSIESRIDESYEVKSSIIIDQITEKDTEKSDNSNVNVSLESSINDFDELESKILTNKIIEGDKDKSGDSVVNVPIESNIDDLNEIEFSLIIDQLIESSNNDFDEIESKILTDKIIEEDKDKSVDSDVNFLIESNIYESRRIVIKTGNVEEVRLTGAVNDETGEVVYDKEKSQDSNDNRAYKSESIKKEKFFNEFDFKNNKNNKIKCIMTNEEVNKRNDNANSSNFNFEQSSYKLLLKIQKVQRFIYKLSLILKRQKKVDL
jgi:hypothetical protein